jgi:hypothetical protein
MTVRLAPVDLPQIPDHRMSSPHVAGRLARSCSNMRRHYFGMFHGQFTTDRTISLDEGLRFPLLSILALGNTMTNRIFSRRQVPPRVEAGRDVHLKLGMMQSRKYKKTCMPPSILPAQVHFLSYLKSLFLYLLRCTLHPFSQRC